MRLYKSVKGPSKCGFSESSSISELKYWTAKVYKRQFTIEALIFYNIYGDCIKIMITLS